MVIRVFTARPRHWGSQLAHLGLAAIILGITGTSVYAIKQNATLTTDSQTTAKVGSYTLALHGLEQVQRENHAAVIATLDVTDAVGRKFVLQPECRFYNQNPQQSNSKVGIRFGLGEDVYVTLAGWENNGKLVAVQAIINPLVNWIWIGGGLLTLGGLICLVPVSQRATVAAAETSAAPSRLTTGKTARDRRRARFSENSLAGQRR